MVLLHYIFICFITTSNADLATDLNNEIGTTGGLCDDFGDTFNTLGSTLGGSINDIIDFVDDIPDLVETLETLAKLPFSIIANQSSEIESLANTISTCINTVIGVFGTSPLDEIFGAINVLPVDLSNVPYLLMAVSLLPVKNQVEFLCNVGLSDALSLVQNWKGIIINSRRRTMGNKPFSYGQMEIAKEIIYVNHMIFNIHIKREGCIIRQ
eukprot:148651_1